MDDAISPILHVLQYRLREIGAEIIASAHSADPRLQEVAAIVRSDNISSGTKSWKMNVRPSSSASSLGERRVLWLPQSSFSAASMLRNAPQLFSLSSTIPWPECAKSLLSARED